MSHNNLNSKTQSTYKTIIERLMKEIKEAAASEGCSEDTLKELRQVRRILFNIDLIIVMGD